MEFTRLLGALLDSSVRDVFIVNCKGHTHDGVDTNAPDPWLIIANFFNSLSFKPDTYLFSNPPTCGFEAREPNHASYPRQEEARGEMVRDEEKVDHLAS